MDGMCSDDGACYCAISLAQKADHICGTIKCPSDFVGFNAEESLCPVRTGTGFILSACNFQAISALLLDGHGCLIKEA